MDATPTQGRQLTLLVSLVLTVGAILIVRCSCLAPSSSETDALSSRSTAKPDVLEASAALTVASMQTTEVLDDIVMPDQQNEAGAVQSSNPLETQRCKRAA